MFIHQEPQDSSRITRELPEVFPLVGINQGTQRLHHRCQRMRIMLPYFVHHQVEDGADPQVFGFGVGDGQDLADLRPGIGQSFQLYDHPATPSRFLGHTERA